jgi:hypothetical protein
MVVGNSSSRVNEEMGIVPIWKLPDLTHEILLWKERKEKKNRGQRVEEEEGTHEWV